MTPRSVQPAVRVQVRGAVAACRFGRGDGNRLDVATSGDLCAAAAAIADDPRVRVVLLEGAGGDFCLGASDPWGDQAAAADGIAAFAALAVPTVAVLRGTVAGLGLALALACDVRCAARDARFSIVDPVRGPLAVGGGLARLPRLIGPARAAEMALLGTTLSASTALAWGLVTQVAPPKALRAAAQRLARAVAARAPLGIRYAKEAVGRALDLPLDDGIRLEQDLYVLLQTTADRREGVAAFVGRRPARFQGR